MASSAVKFFIMVNIIRNLDTMFSYFEPMEQVQLRWDVLRWPKTCFDNSKK